MTDRVGVQMLHHYEPRLLFRLISGRRGESPWHPNRLCGSFSAGAWLQARVARSSYLLAISRIVCSSRESRISVRNGTRMCSQLQPSRGVSMGPPFYRATMRSPRRDPHASQ